MHTNHLPINTSKMSTDQVRALEVAESARDREDASKGFAAQLLFGHFRSDLIMPFPHQQDDDRRVGDELVARVTEFLSANLDPEEADATRTIPQNVIDGLRRIGVFKMKVPMEYKGLGLSQVNYNRVIQAIASYCGSTAVLVSAHQSIGVPTPLKLYGSEEQRRKYLTRIARGDLSAFALTEPEVGSDPARMTTTATPIEGGMAYLINGVKQWCTNGPIADQIVVMARTPDDDGKPAITAFLVEGDSEGVEHVHRCDFMGLRAIQNGIIRFTDVRVPRQNIIWGEGKGLKLALKTLNTGRLTLPAACAGIGKQCLAIAREWGAEREQWGKPIGEHEAGAAKIAAIAADTFAMDSVAWLTSHWGDQAREIRIDAAMAKLFCSETAWRVVDTTMQLRGGRGYERADSLRERGEKPFPVERMMRDCRINTIIEGTSDIMRLFIAREALEPHLRVAGGLLRSRASIFARIGALGSMSVFYPRWYAARRIRSRTGPRFRFAGPLATHFRFIDRASNRLAAELFRAMVRHRARLEQRQFVLASLMDAGTELFAMAAACAHAHQLVVYNGTDGRPIDLADLFCRGARGRIVAHLNLARRNNQRRANKIAKGVLTGKFRWLETGSIPARVPPPPGEESPHRGRRPSSARRPPPLRSSNNGT